MHSGAQQVRYRHPFPADWHEYAAFDGEREKQKSHHSGSSTPGLPQPTPSTTENSVQMEEGVGEGGDRVGEGIGNEVEKNKIGGGRRRVAPPVDFDAGPSPEMAKALAAAIALRQFEDFWAVYPKGKSPKGPARKAFLAALRENADADAIILGARKYAGDVQRGLAEEIAAPETWLMERRWVALASSPLISAEANELANEIAAFAGHDIAFIPPSWMGAPWRVQQWLNEGWRPDLIRLAVRKMMATKSDGPPFKVEYFEKGIAREHATENAPIPTTTITELAVRTKHAKVTPAQRAFQLAAEAERRELAAGIGRPPEAV
jgi:hypothetical protein